VDPRRSTWSAASRFLVATACITTAGGLAGCSTRHSSRNPPVLRAQVTKLPGSPVAETGSSSGVLIAVQRGARRGLVLRLVRGGGHPVVVGSVPPGPTALAAWRKTAWVASNPQSTAGSGRGGSIVRMDESTNRSIGRPIKIDSPMALAVDGTGAWVLSGPPAHHDYLLHIAPNGKTLVRIRVPGWEVGFPQIALGMGSVWVLSSTTTGLRERSRLTRIDLTENRVTEIFKLPSATSLAVVRGRLWIATRRAHGRGSAELIHLSPRLDRLASQRIPLPRASVLTGGDGRVWVTGVNVLSRIDPGSSRVVSGVVKGLGEPYGLVYEGHGLWLIGSGLSAAYRVNSRFGNSG